VAEDPVPLGEHRADPLSPLGHLDAGEPLHGDRPPQLVVERADPIVTVHQHEHLARVAVLGELLGRAMHIPDDGLGLRDHLAVELEDDAEDAGLTDEQVIDMAALLSGDPEQRDIIVGSGGVLSHAPRRVQAMRMMVDAFLPEGVTELAVDSIFMMPHLGVLSTINEKAATDVFVRDCMIYLGTCVAPIGQGRDGDLCADYEITWPDGKTTKEPSTRKRRCS